MTKRIAILVAVSVAGSGAACSPCQDDVLFSSTSPSGHSAKTALRNCGATTKAMIAVSIDGELVIVVNRYSGVRIRWIGEALEVEVPREVPESEILFQSMDTAKRIVLVRKAEAVRR